MREITTLILMLAAASCGSDGEPESDPKTTLNQEQVRPASVRPAVTQCAAPADPAGIEVHVSGLGSVPKCAVSISGVATIELSGSAGTKVALLDQEVTFGDDRATLDLDLRSWLTTAPASAIAPMKTKPRQPLERRKRRRLETLPLTLTFTAADGKGSTEELEINLSDASAAATWIIAEASGGRAVPGDASGGVLFRSPEYGTIRRVGSPATIGSAKLYAVGEEVTRSKPKKCGPYTPAGNKKVMVSRVWVSEKVSVFDHEGKKVDEKTFPMAAQTCPQFTTVPDDDEVVTFPPEEKIAAWLAQL